MPKLFPIQGMNNHYICIGVKSSDSVDKMSKIHKARLMSASMNKWNKMQRQIKQGVFKMPFGDVYDKIILLHNPTLPLVKEEKPKVKGLSPKQKGKAKEMKEEGKELLEIALQLDVEIERVEAYLNK